MRTTSHSSRRPTAPALSRAVSFALAIAIAAPPATARAQRLTPSQQQDLARIVQNPIAAMTVLPLQNSTNFGYGPNDDVQNLLNIQPVWPISLNASWNVISRTIVPVLYQPPAVVDGGEYTFGVGDINQSFFLSPAAPGKAIWGLGATATFPTATNERLGTGKWSAGPALVLLKMTGPWVVGALAHNQWSYAGDDVRGDVNAFLLQYFVNYYLNDGWYLSSSPINTADWNADTNDQWTVPVGGGVGKIFRTGTQAMNAQAHLYFNAVKPEHMPAPDWTLRLQVTWMYPK